MILNIGFFLGFLHLSCRIWKCSLVADFCNIPLNMLPFWTDTPKKLLLDLRLLDYKCYRLTVPCNCQKLGGETYSSKCLSGQYYANNILFGFSSKNGGHDKYTTDCGMCFMDFHLSRYPCPLDMGVVVGTGHSKIVRSNEKCS